MTTALELTDVSFCYAGEPSPALSQLTFSVPERSVCAVLGSTSAGKSTLLQVLAGLAAKQFPAATSSGRLTILGSSFDEAPRDILFPLVGIVLQEPRVMISGMYETVREELAFTLHNLDVPKNEVDSRVADMLNALHLSHLADRHPLELSGGEQQRVAMGTILVAQPKILLLDEPRNALDCEGLETLLHLVRRYKRSTTLIFSDYQIEFALAAADYILVLHRGRNMFFGETSQFIKQARHFAATLVPQEWIEFFERASDAGPSQDAGRILSKVGLYAAG